jgi:hypothetical protein
MRLRTRTIVIVVHSRDSMIPTQAFCIGQTLLPLSCIVMKLSLAVKFNLSPSNTSLMDVVYIPWQNS